MQPLDNIGVWIEKIQLADCMEVLSQSDQQEWNLLSVEERSARLKNILENPVDDNTVVYRWYFRNKWTEALKSVKSDRFISLLEVGAGSSDMLPQIMAKTYEHPDTRYITANMNKKLTASLKEKTKELPIRVEVIEDDAQNIYNHIGEEKFDVIAFEHSVNDILQTVLAERKGIDTTHEDWWQILPQMIEIIKAEYIDGTLENSVKNELQSLIRSCLRVLKPGGYIVINHFMYQYDLNLGYQPELWENMLPIVRKWINNIGGGKEVFFKEFNPQWWMFFRKDE